MANDFSGDANCVAVYNMEAGAATEPNAKNPGTFNLTYNSSAGHDVTQDATNKWQGSYSTSFPDTSSGYFTLADTAGFPFNSADATKTCTITFWYRPTTLNVNYTGILGYYTYADAGGWGIYNGNLANWVIAWKYATNHEYLASGFTATAGQVYHIGLVVDGSTTPPTFHLRVWDVTAATVTNYDPTAASQAMTVVNAGFAVGAWAGGGGGHMIGNLDEIVVFSDKKTDDQIDAIRGGTYAVAATNLIIDGVEAASVDGVASPASVNGVTP